MKTAVTLLTVIICLVHLSGCPEEVMGVPNTQEVLRRLPSARTALEERALFALLRDSRPRFGMSFLDGGKKRFDMATIDWSRVEYVEFVLDLQSGKPMASHKLIDRDENLILLTGE